jgi:hypothetical protein
LKEEMQLDEVISTSAMEGDNVMVLLKNIVGTLEKRKLKKELNETKENMLEGSIRMGASNRQP